MSVFVSETGRALWIGGNNFAAGCEGCNVTAISRGGSTLLYGNYTISPTGVASAVCVVATTVCVVASAVCVVASLAA